MPHLTGLEISLLCICILFGGFIFRLLIRERVLRYFFIKSNEWSANKIDEIVESAKYTIIDEVKIRYPDYTDERVAMYIPIVISNARDEWQRQTADFQKSLLRNGIAPLGGEDVTFGLSNHLK